MPATRIRSNSVMTTPHYREEPSHNEEAFDRLDRLISPPSRVERHPSNRLIRQPSAKLSRTISLSRQRTSSTAGSGSAQPDLSFPTITTNVEAGGFSQEYTTANAKGFVLASAPIEEGGLERSATRLLTRTPTRTAAEAEKNGGELKLVTWKVDDKQDPRNWSSAIRWGITFIVAMNVVQVAFSSAVVTGDFGDIKDELHVGDEAVALSVSLMVVGFGLGPLAWSPLSEIYGRRPLWIIPSIIYIIFIIPCALAPNIGCLLAARFLCGFFASAPLTLAGGTIADIWGPEERGLAIAMFAAAPYGGPVLGPIIGGFVGETMGWRWIFWVNMMFAGVTMLPCLLIPETFAPVILKKRARQLRRSTGDPTFVTEQEIFMRPFSDILMEALVRPFVMLMEEPILLLMSLYIALIYGLLYAFFFSFPIVFGSGGYDYNDGLVGLTFIPVFIGLAGALFVTPYLEKRYLMDAKENGGHAEPESRLPGMMLGSLFIPISLFIFGWTAPPYVMPHGGSWVGPCSAGIPFGFGMVVLYASANAYLIDAFPAYVASALAAKTVVRSGMGAAMVLFIPQMFRGLGNGGAASLLGGVAILMIPIPFLFYKYGKSIRSRSKRAAE